MKVLWLSPWLRPLTTIHARLLLDAGVEVRVVTTDLNPAVFGPELPHEWVVDPRWKRPWTWPRIVRLIRDARRFRADVVVTELVRDPRWILLDRSAPRIDVIHDDQPHDAAEQLPRWERRLFGRWRASAVLTLMFSRHVADATGVRPFALVPLTSDVPDAEVPPFVAAAGRRDFVLTGRLNGYKNIPTVLQAWTRHVEGPHHRGDELVLIGESDRPLDLPAGVRWIDGAFEYADVLPTLARAKASVVHYRVATQSGVQVLAMQLGVMPIVSDQGALPEYQPADGPVVAVDDVAGLAAAFDRLAAPDEAERLGRSARATFEQHHAPDVVRDALLTALDQATDQSQHPR